MGKPVSYRYWTNHQVKFLTEKWGRLSAKRIAEKLDRSYDSVLKKASKLGLRSTRPITIKHDLNLLKARIDHGHHPTTLAKAMNTSTKAVYHTVRDRLGEEWYAKLLKNVEAHNKRNKRLTPIYKKQA